MTVATPSASPWLLLAFNLPSKHASARVEIWRKVRKFGALPLRTSGYLLPNQPENQERFEWLASIIRKYKGEATIAQVSCFDGLPHEQLAQMFLAARDKDYQQLINALKRRPTPNPRQLSGLRRRLQEIAAIDFFQSPLRVRLESMMSAAEKGPEKSSTARSRSKREFLNRTWITRPRPGIDRVSSAWLIQRFIDPTARFIFGADPRQVPHSIPFDMFVAEGFGHRGDDCTFETLCKEFSIKDPKVRSIAQIIHDADLGDEKFGRSEGSGLDRVLNGWARQQISDQELLNRGVEMIEGLYCGM
jgi:hypothetical protein